MLCACWCLVSASTPCAAAIPAAASALAVLCFCMGWLGAAAQARALSCSPRNWAARHLLRCPVCTAAARAVHVLLRAAGAPQHGAVSARRLLSLCHRPGGCFLQPSGRPLGSAVWCGAAMLLRAARRPKGCRRRCWHAWSCRRLRRRRLGHAGCCPLAGDLPEATCMRGGCKQQRISGSLAAAAVPGAFPYITMANGVFGKVPDAAVAAALLLLCSCLLPLHVDAASGRFRSQRYCRRLRAKERSRRQLVRCCCQHTPPVGCAGSSSGFCSELGFATAWLPGQRGACPALQ